MVRKLLKAKVVLFVTGFYLGVYYLALIAGQPLYDNKIFLYLFLAVLSGLFGVIVAIVNSLISVEFVKQTDEAYLARAGAIMSAMQSAASPLVAFLVSGMAALWNTQVIFLGTGILAIFLSFPLLFTKTLDALDEAEPGKEREQAARQEEISQVAE